MDDLLHQAKLTLSCLHSDLRAGYHQAKVHVEDQDKTAFVCPLALTISSRMPYGLRNAPATFQRLMNRFCSGLEDILALPYLDDIIVLSETFENTCLILKLFSERPYISNLEPIENEKMPFASSSTNILILITQKGIGVDPRKSRARHRIFHPLKTSKNYNLFCKLVRGFEDIFKILRRFHVHSGYLNKEESQVAVDLTNKMHFKPCKNSPAAPPVLKQADGTKPESIIRTDASNYAPLSSFTRKEKDPLNISIEYASRSSYNSSFATEPSIPRQARATTTTANFVSPRRDVVGSHRVGDCNLP
ncbi:retrovirus-related Pol polyprotein from transposon 297 [Trichonephila clavipes]|nr:retrovirus-related Pol polyprotein from transposon 297 [Trichonephila clavipes]